MKRLLLEVQYTVDMGWQGATYLIDWPYACVTSSAPCYHRDLDSLLRTMCRWLTYVRDGEKYVVTRCEHINIEGHYSLIDEKTLLAMYTRISFAYKGEWRKDC